MTNHPPGRTAAARENNETALAHRVAALELLVQQLLFVLDAQGTLSIDALSQWLGTATGRMRATGSVAPEPLRALEALAELVCE